MTPRVLVLGATGMLGHKVWQVCRSRFDTWAAVRARPAGWAAAIFDDPQVLTGVQVMDRSSVLAALAVARPTVVINCIGIVKQLDAARDVITSLQINALWPHELAQLCALAGARVIHISTDCVFSGRKGMYEESDIPDAEDLYGRSKLLGEINQSHALTLRTSIIGREIGSRNGLVEWFIRSPGPSVTGYRRAVFSGVTTPALATVIADLIERHPTLTGLYQVAAEPITKYELLLKLRDTFQLPLEVEPDDVVVVDRSLVAERFWKTIGSLPPDWPAMLEALAADQTGYPLPRSS